MAVLESGFKDYMIILGNESVEQETKKFTLALQKLMTEKALDALAKKTGNSDNDELLKLI